MEGKKLALGIGAKKSTTMDMTAGPILKLLVVFALPLLLGNLFQMLYNTVDVLVVGNFVGKEALAAVGSTSTITNVAVFFFNGFSVGGGVVISRYYGAHDHKGLHRAVETTMAVTFLLSVVLTVIGALTVPFMLRFMSTPEDVMEAASTYLRIYFIGFGGLLIYNMGSGVLRAVGDTTRPLLFLIFTSLLNIVLDLLFVVGFHLGIAGVAYATVFSQLISALLVLRLLTHTADVYRMTWHELAVDWGILRDIFSVGLPAGIQSMITSFSNVFVQSYVNAFGSGAMAGWGCYNKLNQFIFLPIQSMASSATTFVSQNMGARQEGRANQGTKTAMLLSLTMTACTASFIFLFANPAMVLFSRDAEVMRYGVYFTRLNVFFLLFNTINHVLAGALRGRGDAKGPMYIMLLCFVAFRQIYLFIGSQLVHSEVIVGLAYPVGWVTCCIIELSYYYLRWRRPSRQKAA